MNDEYLRGALARAQRQPFQFGSKDFQDGYEAMQAKLSPIETEIQLAAIRYRAVAEATFREMEGRSSDPGVARAAAVAADGAISGERPATTPATGDITGV